MATNKTEQEAMLEGRVMYLEKTVEEIRDALRSIAASLQILTRLEASHSEMKNGVGRAFKAIEDHETRLRAVEAEMPTVKLTRGWVITAATAIVGVLAFATFKMVVG